jgi:hypothetical protein
MDQLDDIDALRARDAERGRAPMTADDMRTAALNKLRTQAPRESTRELAKAHNQASSKQVGFVMVLLRKLADHNPVVEATARAWWMERAIVEDGRVVGTRLTREQVSDTITRLRKHLEAPAKPAQLAVEPTTTPVAPVDTPNERHALQDVLKALPMAHHTGTRYALPHTDNPDAYTYLWMKESKRGNRYLVSGVGGAHGDLVWSFLKIENGALTLARRIAEDPNGAMIRFGQVVGSCGHCGRTLTNQASREAGIGPVCARKA